MDTSEHPTSPQSNPTTLPRWAALTLGLFVWLVAVPLAHAVLPWAISLVGTRYGWTDGHAGIWNLAGLIPIALGTAVLVWVMVLGFAETPERVELGLTPSFLLMRGPYALTRNPMYVSELGLWFGWAIFYGGVLVFIGFVLLWLGTNFIILPREERALEDHFGDAYREFRNRVPRWLRKTAGH